MTTPATIKVTQYFNKVASTPITSTPTHESMKTIQTELNANTMSVPSDNTPFRHLILTMTPANYILKTTEPFAPTSPPKQVRPENSSRGHSSHNHPSPLAISGGEKSTRRLLRNGQSLTNPTSSCSRRGLL